jgi:phospholipase C
MTVEPDLGRLIDHVVIIVKENHTFDNYFGTFPGVDGAGLAAAQNPPPADPLHTHEAWDARATDAVHRVQYSEHDIPPYFALARQYTLCDRYFSEVTGPSTPNHLMLIAADSPVINNPHRHYRPAPRDTYDLRSMPAALEHAGITWGNYGGYAFHYIKEVAGHQNNFTSDLFAHHAAAGHLPAVSWVYAEGKPSLSEHPTQNVTDGALWTAQQIQAIVTGGLWDRIVVFITWDDWGGWYDHEPPTILAAPQGGYQLGFRVPMVVVSAFTPAGLINNNRHDFGSILRFVEHNFGIPEGSLTFADARATNDLTGFFRLNQPPRPFQPIPSALTASFFLNDKSKPIDPDDDDD